jgi:AAA lid domain
VTLSNEVLFILRDVRAYMRDDMDPPVYCSDRRLVKAATMLKVVAASRGRTVVSPLDCVLLQHVLWHSPEDQVKIRDWLWQRAVPDPGIPGLEYVVGSLIKRISSIYRQVNENETPPEAESLMQELEMYAKLLSTKAAEFRQIADDCRGYSNAAVIQSPAPSSPTMQGDGVSALSTAHLWLSSSESASARQQLTPRAEQFADALTSLLSSVLAVKSAIVSRGSVGSNPEGATSSSFDLADAVEELWVRYGDRAAGSASRSGAGRIGSDDASDDDGRYGGSQTLTAAVLGMTKKEAQRTLSAEDFKLWKKAQKTKKKMKADDDGDDDY